MTKRLDEFFNVDGEEENEDKPQTKELTVIDDNMSVDLTDLDKTILELSEVSAHSEAMDSLAETAMNTYADIIDMANNVDERNAASYLSVAANMMKNAINAKNSKEEARQKAAALLMRKQRMDADKELDDAGVIDSEAELDEDAAEIVGDRNEVLNMIKKKGK